MTVPFLKMHGLGNDFVVIDARDRPMPMDPVLARAIADRRRGVGCDQLILIEPATNGAAAASMRILNADGSEAEACGNATRCVGDWLMGETGTSSLLIDTRGGQLQVERRADGQVAVDMGPARLDWQDIPLAQPQDTLHLGISHGGLADPVGVGMGNPHAVFLVTDAEAVPLEELGPGLEHHPLFPQRANIGVCQVIDRRTLRLRVWERGAGLTMACGSGACAALVASVRRGVADREATVLLDGGQLGVAWRSDGHVVMAGPAAVSFTGIWPHPMTGGPS